MKLCIFPNDPLIAYYKKGEIKENYYNPKNYFDEIHFISFIDKDIEESKIQKLVGDASIHIHSVGKIGIWNRKKHVKNILDIVTKINPDVIRAYNPFLEGWFAAQCADKLHIPFFLSLHTQYDTNRDHAKKSNFKKYLALKYTEKFIEPFVLSKADKITIVYKIIEPYVKKHTNLQPEILHNKVNLQLFQKSNRISSLKEPLIISVGSLIPVKNHQCLIEAMREIDANLLIIGDGILHNELSKLIGKYRLENKISLLKSVPNGEIPNYFKSAKLFALAYDPEVEGIPIPVIEAMASKLPIVIPYLQSGYEEGLDDVALFSERNPKEFSKTIKKLLSDESLQKTLSEKSFIKSKEFDSEKIESRELEIYVELMGEEK